MEGVHPLKAFRESQQPRLTQAELARRLGVARPTVHRWESGARNIERDLLQKVSEVTKIPKSELRPDWAETLEAAE